MSNEKNEIVTTGYEIQSAKSEPVVRKFNLKKSKPVVWKSQKDKSATLSWKSDSIGSTVQTKLANTEIAHSVGEIHNLTLISMNSRLRGLKARHLTGQSVRAVI